MVLIHSDSSLLPTLHLRPGPHCSYVASNSNCKLGVTVWCPGTIFSMLSQTQKLIPSCQTLNLSPLKGLLVHYSEGGASQGSSLRIRSYQEETRTQRTNPPCPPAHPPVSSTSERTLQTTISWVEESAQLPTMLLCITLSMGCRESGDCSYHHIVFPSVLN